MNELNKLLDLLRYAVEQGQTITLTADEITISVAQEGGVEISVNGPRIDTMN